ncbi:MAG: tRNA dimethylallyltransferase [Candidatus Omnitrophota bacterium]
MIKSASPLKRPNITIFIIGPTASGKTAVAQHVAKLLDIEVIICDSMQVYKDMPILSQATSADEMANTPYHLNQYLEVSQDFNASEFIKACDMLIPQIQSKQKVPLIVGGTGLYYSSLMDGLCEAPEEDLELRQQLELRAETEGTQQLHAELKLKDPEAAAKIHPNDLKRIIRALEVIHLTGHKFSDLQQNRQGLNDIQKTFVYGLDWPRAELYQRINDRVDQMLNEGALDEVKKLGQQTLSRNASHCLGYQELMNVLNKSKTIDEATAELKQNTRRFAKRQLTWFRRDERIHWFDMQNTNVQNAAEFIAAQVDSHV